MWVTFAPNSSLTQPKWIGCQNISGELGQYICCWCPGSLGHQDIKAVVFTMKDKQDQYLEGQVKEHILNKNISTRKYCEYYREVSYL